VSNSLGSMETYMEKQNYLPTCANSSFREKFLKSVRNLREGEALSSTANP